LLKPKPSTHEYGTAQQEAGSDPTRMYHSVAVPGTHPIFGWPADILRRDDRRSAGFVRRFVSAVTWGRIGRQVGGNASAPGIEF
jgi:hypothetical protein